MNKNLKIALLSGAGVLLLVLLLKKPKVSTLPKTLTQEEKNVLFEEALARYTGGAAPSQEILENIKKGVDAALLKIKELALEAEFEAYKASKTVINEFDLPSTTSEGGDVKDEPKLPTGLPVQVDLSTIPQIASVPVVVENTAYAEPTFQVATAPTFSEGTSDSFPKQTFVPLDSLFPTKEDTSTILVKNTFQNENY